MRSLTLIPAVLFIAAITVPGQDLGSANKLFGGGKKPATAKKTTSGKRPPTVTVAKKKPAPKPTTKKDTGTSAKK